MVPSFPGRSNVKTYTIGIGTGRYGELDILKAAASRGGGLFANATNFGASTRTVSAPAAVPTRGEIEMIALPSYSEGSFWMYRSAPTKMQRAMTAAGFHRQRRASTRSGSPPDSSAKTLLSRSR